MLPNLLVTVLAIACILIVFALYGALVMSGHSNDRNDAMLPSIAPVCVEPQLSIVVPDDELHHWGEVYTANPQLRRAGVLFSTFVRHPEQILQAIALRAPAIDAEPEAPPADDFDAQDHPPLALRDAYGIDTTTCDDIHPARLVADAETQLARDAFGPRLRYRDGAYVEPLHHHRFQPHAETRPHRPWRLTGAR